MTNEEKYNALYAAVKKQEDKNECPLLVYGAWFNTDGDGYIDMETSKGTVVTNDIEDIEELLAESDLVLTFAGDQPQIKEVKMEINREEVLKVASEFDVGQSDTLETFLCALLKTKPDNLYKELFDRLPAKEKENKLMEAAIRIQEVFDALLHKGELNEGLVYNRDSMEIYALFRDWAREFEYKYFDTDEFLSTSEEFAAEKIMEEFG